MKLVICEKPSVRAAVAAALGVTGRKDGYIEETATSFLGVSGIWYSFPKLPPMGNSTRNGAMTAYPFCRRNGSTP